MKKLLLLSFLFTCFLFFIKTAHAIDNLPALCKDGMYDYCSQAPKCGEYPDVTSQTWLNRSTEIWNTYQNHIKEYCYTPQSCYGYVPLCCYEMVRTKDKDKCWGIDTLNCLPTQCNQVPDSESKNCGLHILNYCPERTSMTENELRNKQPVPLSERFQNDILFRLLDNNPSVHESVKTSLPWLWNAYQTYLGSSTPTPPAGPTRTPTPTITPPGGGPTLTPTRTPTPGGPTATSAPGQPTATWHPVTSPVTTSSGILRGIIAFTGWDFLANYDPLLLATMGGLLALTVFVFTR